MLERCHFGPGCCLLPLIHRLSKPTATPNYPIAIGTRRCPRLASHSHESAARILRSVRCLQGAFYQNCNRRGSM
eukprot:scaffold169914_cov14-Prasinocladus_malaysianus.AAC.2